MNQKVFTLFFLLSITALSTSKIVETSLSYYKFQKNGNYMYISKFSEDIGLGSYKLKAKFSQPLVLSKLEEKTSIMSGIIDDDGWESFQLQETCTDKKKAIRFYSNLEIPNDGVLWSGEHFQHLSQVVRRRTYFFFILDCDENLKGKAPSGLKFEIKMEVLNKDESHFSSEEEGFVTSFFVLFIICTLFFSKNIQRLLRQSKREEETDWAFLIANSALFLLILNLLFEWIHMLIYSSNGTGSVVLQLFGQLFGIASQFTMACIFILISWGWTINYTELENFDIYVPLAILFGIIHMMIMGLSKLTDDESHKYHQYTGAVGWIIVILRIGMYIYFLFGIKDTLKTAREKVKDFIIKFTFFGTVFFLAFPIILFISSFIAGYVQHRVVTIGTLCIQSIAMIIMSYLFTSKSSGYYKASVKSNPLLPTGKAD